MSNPFLSGYYDDCLTEFCAHKTQHKSGYCEKCRNYLCIHCSKRFVAQSIIKTKPKCSQCRLRNRQGRGAT